MKFNKSQAFRIIAIAAFLLLITFFFGTSLKLPLLVVFVIVLGASSTLYYNFFHGPINFELIKFGTILLAITQGAIPAALAGIIASVLSRLLTGRIDFRLVLSIIGITLISFASVFVSNWDIRIAGIVLVLLYHLIITPLSLSLGDQPAFVTLYVGSNIFFNVIIFLSLGQIGKVLFLS